MSTTHSWLGDGAVLASVHLPDDRPATVGVVVCPPIGQEYITAYRGLRLLAEQLAASGVAALRFDYPGFGDSTSAATASSLDDGPRIAARTLRSIGIERIVYLGLASGALLAAEAAASDPDAAGVVLWDAPSSGRAWLRRVRALYTLSVGEEDAGTPGTIAGAELDADVRARLSAIVLRGSSAGASSTESLAARMPTVLAVRPETEQSDGPDAKARVVVVDDTHTMLDASSISARVAGGAITSIVDRIVGEFIPPVGSVPGPGVQNFAGEASTTFVATTSALLEERIVDVGPDRLFGIETLPARREGALPDAHAPGVVLLNGSSEHRIGASRYQVELARELASRGMRVLRVDRRGTGESGAVTVDEPNLLFSREWLDDGRAAILHLDLPRERVGIIGMCVGAWIGLKTDPSLSRFVVALSLNDFRLKPAAHNDVSDAETDGSTSASLRSRVVDFAKRRLPYPLLMMLARRGYVQLAEVALRPMLAAGSNVTIFAGPLDSEILAARHGESAVTRLASESGELRVIHHPTGDHSLFGPEIRASAIRQAVMAAEAAFALN